MQKTSALLLLHPPASRPAEWREPVSANHGKPGAKSGVCNVRLHNKFWPCVATTPAAQPSGLTPARRLRIVSGKTCTGLFMNKTSMTLTSQLVDADTDLLLSCGSYKLLRATSCVAELWWTGSEVWQFAELIAHDVGLVVPHGLRPSVSFGKRKSANSLGVSSCLKRQLRLAFYQQAIASNWWVLYMQKQTDFHWHFQQ